MATLLTALTKLSSYHLLAWGSLLGMQLYQVCMDFFRKHDSARFPIKDRDRDDAFLYVLLLIVGRDRPL